MREKILLALFLLTFPVVAYISTLPPQRFRNEITEWGDRNTTAYAEFTSFREKFGANETVIFSWPGCDLEDERVETVAVQIEQQLVGLVRNVSSGRRAYRSLRDDARLTDEATLKRLRNVFIGKTGEMTAVGFQLTESARSKRGEVLTKLEKIIDSSGVDPASVVYAGLGHNLYTLDKEGLESPFRMVPQIMLLAFLLTIVFVRNIWLAFFINALGTYTGCLSFNIVYLANVDMNAIIWPLPTLTMLLTVSAALHFLSYFKKAAESHARSIGLGTASEFTKPERLVHRRAVARSALRSAAKPILCCTMTTAIGLLSLLLSTSEPVRQFGFFGALSIVAANLLLLLWFPPFLVLVKQLDRIWSSYSESVAAETQKPDEWSCLAKFTRTQRYPIVVTCFILLGITAFGFPKIKTGSSLDNFFPAGHSVLSSGETMQTRVGPLNSVELLLQFDNADPDNDRLRLRGLRSLASRIESETDFESCLSAAVFSPNFKPQRAGARDTIEKTRVKQFKEELVNAGFVYANPETKQETWRVSCRYSIFEEVDLEQQTGRLKEIVSELFFREGEMVIPGEALKVTTTGEFVLFDLVDRQFFKELMQTYLTAFVVIALIVLVVLRDLRAALLALLPNLFPAVVVLGAAGLLGLSLDVASLMTASVALGIAVDDTLHFLLWNQEVKNGQQQVDPIGSAMRYCGRAMIQTSMILGLSIVLYAFCGFLPTVRFGILLSAMMFAAIVGDLLLLPALMAFAEKTK